MKYSTVVARAIESAGGIDVVARKLGHPVNRYVVSVWKRNASIPEEHREEIARLAGVDPFELLPPTSEGGRLRFKGEAQLYRKMLRALELSSRSAARVHNVDHGEVLNWINGSVQVPVKAFGDLHLYSSGLCREVHNLSVDKAMGLLNVNQRQLAELAGVTPAIVTRWRGAGLIPERHARMIIRRGRNRDAPLCHEADEDGYYSV